MKKLILILAVAVFSACTAMYFPTSSAYSKNSIYYTSVEEVNTSVSDTLVYVDEESYAAKLHKFDSPTYTIELNLTPWYPTHYTNYWRWNSWCITPTLSTLLYWDWYDWNYRWPYTYNIYYGYYGYYHPYNPYRYRYYSYWEWHRPYYTYYKPHRPHVRPNHDVRYTRRGGVTPRPKVQSFDGNRSRNHEKYRRSTAQPTRRATVSRSSSQPRQATTSRKTNVRYDSSARPVSRSQSQANRTGYSRSTTNNRSSNTGRTYYNNGPSQRTQPSVRYSERNTSSQNSGVSRSSSGGSSTRRK